MTFGPYCLLSLVCCATQALAAGDPSQLCDLAAQGAARKTGVPIDLLLAITRVETGRGTGDALQPWPWTINSGGSGSFYASQSEAATAAEARLADGTDMVDIGCFQLNFRWHGDAFTSLTDMFDPVQNADYAAGFLLRLYQESGDWAEAVAFYHSRTGTLAEAYLDRVKAVLNAPDTAPPPEPPPELPRENRFPLLQAGDHGSAGSLVPLQSARGPLIGG